ncbi:hypothetical protein J7M23_11600 [Candidatus Sumerlaeota bacterium]|nr:hypothetical protein [Candidatus Sumerlaeota bacterium]
MFGKKRSLILVGLILLAVFSASLSTNAETEKIGVLIITHGSFDPEWNKRISANLENIVTSVQKQLSTGVEIRAVSMECIKPDIADGVNELMQKGVSRILAIPLFIAPSSHTERDIPQILGLIHSPETIKSLNEEEISLCSPSVPITVATSLYESEIIPEIMAKRVKALSSNPEKEGVVILAHGSNLYKPFWDKLMKRIEEKIKDDCRIDYFDYIYVGIGQGLFTKKGIKVIRRAVRKKKRVIIVGAFLGMGAEKVFNRWWEKIHIPDKLKHIHQRQISEKEKKKLMKQKESANKYFQKLIKKRRILLSRDGIFPDDSITQWIITCINDYKKSH